MTAQYPDENASRDVGPYAGPAPQQPTGGYGRPGYQQYGGYAQPGDQPPYPPQPYAYVGYAQPGYPQPYAVAPKSPGLALLASFFIPGLGSMMNGDVGKGVGILVGYIVSWFLTIILIGFVGLIAFWVWGMVDGYSGARQWNARHGILS